MNSEAARLLTAEDLADRWQVKPTSIYQWTREGRIPAVRMGRLYRYRIEAVLEFEAAGGMDD